jgi:hypothetical protein
MRLTIGFWVWQTSAMLAIAFLASPCLGLEEGDGPAKPSAGGYGPQTDAERIDAELIRQEDERDKQKIGEIRYTTEEGKIYLEKEINEQALPWVIGRFAVKGQAYLLLLNSADLFDSLKSHNGKNVRLSGRVRAGGKYFIASSVFVSLNVPSSPPKPGGM